MIDAYDEEDWESYDKWSNYINESFTNLMKIEADLVYYGRFTRNDIQQMKPVERRFHIQEINRRNKEIEELHKNMT